MTEIDLVTGTGLPSASDSATRIIGHAAYCCQISYDRGKINNSQLLFISEFDGERTQTDFDSLLERAAYLTLTPTRSDRGPNSTYRQLETTTLYKLSSLVLPNADHKEDEAGAIQKKVDLVRPILATTASKFSAYIAERKSLIGSQATEEFKKNHPHLTEYAHWLGIYYAKVEMDKFPDLIERKITPFSLYYSALRQNNTGKIPGLNI